MCSTHAARRGKCRWAPLESLKPLLSRRGRGTPGCGSGAAALPTALLSDAGAVLHRQQNDGGKGSGAGAAGGGGAKQAAAAGALQRGCQREQAAAAGTGPERVRMPPAAAIVQVSAIWTEMRMYSTSTGNEFRPREILQFVCAPLLRPHLIITKTVWYVITIVNIFTAQYGGIILVPYEYYMHDDAATVPYS